MRRDLNRSGTGQRGAVEDEALTQVKLDALHVAHALKDEAHAAQQLF